MKKYILMVSVLLVLLCPSKGLAESESLLSLEELAIQVMPEYTYHPNDKEKDHVPLLIGYQGTMVNNSDQPQTGKIEIPLPMKENDFRIGYVADYSSDLSKAYEIEYTIDPEKETISWATSEEIGPRERYKFVIEFYSESINVKKDQKTLQYKFNSFADIDLVDVIFTTPNNAEKVKITPTPSEKENHGDEKNTYSYLFQHVKAGEEKVFTLTYVRSELKPTSELMKTHTMDEKDNKSNGLAVGAFSGVSVLSVSALTFLLRKRKRAGTKA
ncbi:hypothetical protein [Neobacillus drentensis]|uniref:hypothetical protein n=1 Tax=Neobacillus drentensis TaxID=220684 RepID=UPI002FFEB056